MDSSLLTKEDRICLMEEISDNYFGPVVVYDANGTILYVNKRALEKYDLPMDDTVNVTVYDLIRHGVIKDSAAIEVLETHKNAIKYIENKTSIPALAIAIPILDKDQKVKRVIAYSQDVTIPFDLVEKIDSERRTALGAINYLSKSKGDKIIAESDEMKQILEFLSKLAKYDSTIALYGESGSGKEVLARFIHNNSNRANQIWLPLNCAAVPNELIEAELFGYERGSFTGANTEGKAGLFELSDGGTLFLDEIGELSLSIQSKLLRVIETGEIRRIGGNKIIYTNVRLITATNRDLQKMIISGEFREDLFYRINTIPVTVPPLRQRPADIEALANMFLQKINKKTDMNKYISPGTMRALKNHNWPGNVRELRNVIEQLAVSANRNELSFRHMPFLPCIVKDLVLDLEKKSQNHDVMQNPDDMIQPVDGVSLRQAVRDFEKKYIISVLNTLNQNVAESADSMQMHRSALYRKIDEYGIKIKK